MKYITFYTPGFYEDVFHKYLKPSADAVGIDVRAYKEHNYGDWKLNTHQKAHVVLRALHEWGDVVWLDVDAELLGYPKLFEEIPEEFDVGFHYLDWFRQWRGVEGKEKKELVNSVMLLRSRPNVIALVERWIEACRGAGVNDQVVLERVMKETNDVSVFPLPDAYCTILDFQDQVPAYIKDPVIQQHQISRISKDKLK